MSTHRRAGSIYRFDAGRRRGQSLPEHEFLHRLLAAQQDILAAGLDLENVVATVTRRAAELTHSDGAVVEVVDGAHLVYWSASGSLQPSRGVRVRLDESLSGLCVKTGQVLYCEDSETDERVDRAICRQVGLRSMLVAPLTYGGATIGVLKVVSSACKAYAPDDIRTLEHLRTLIAAAITHAAQHALAQGSDGSDGPGDILKPRETRDRIQTALDEEAFDIAWQPIVALDDGRIVGYEALARFRDDRGPEVWFNDAAHAGLGERLEIAVARKALGTLGRLAASQYLAINVSPATVLHDDLEQILRRHDPSRVVVEVTEHAFVEDYADLSARVDRLKRLGVRMAIDDAGAGFASLRHVLRIRPQFIKLDRSLTQNIDREPNHRALAAALLTFAKGTAAVIVAEGVETAEEAATLRDLGVAFAQGFFFGAPETVTGDASNGRIDQD